MLPKSDTLTIATGEPTRVSFDDEPLILVDDQDEVIGYLPKAECHQGDGILHRAFSVFLFDSRNRVLLQKRSDSKPLWPLIWSNSCCSHPRRGETLESAVSRRLREELGISCEAEFLYKFQYHARFEADGELVGSERELCAVFAARLSPETEQADSKGIVVNPTEVADLSWATLEELDARAADLASNLSPWSRMEWKRLRSDLWPQLEQILTAS
ncbi:MAG: isopentenyl-diphosphate Delta-isomerase [Deltaproteobacteria bacterium]|nr:isopentenyl-diphosphate Delta-isomerase [Deltaproteobacteria bacterium]